MKLLSLIIPCYNEADNIPLLLKQIEVVLNKKADIEIILVNNGSTDHTLDVFQTYEKMINDLCMKIVTVNENKGYGFGILAGLKEASCSILSWTHADLQTDLTDIITAYECYTKSQQPCFIKGSRKKRHILERFFTFGMQIYAKMIIGLWLHDINAQPKLFSREFYEKFIINKAPHDFSLDIYALATAKKNKYHIIEFPVYFHKRQHGQAKGGGSWPTRIKLIKRTMTYIKELKNIL